MGCFLTDRRSSIRAVIFACLCRADCVEKPRQSPAMPAFFSLSARQIRRESDRVIELLRSLWRGITSALHLVPYRPMPYAKTKKSMGVGFNYELRTTRHEPLSSPARQIRRESDRVIELLRSLWRGITSALHLVPYRPMPYAKTKKSMGVGFNYELRTTRHEPLSSPARQIRRESDRVIELLRSLWRGIARYEPRTTLNYFYERRDL